MTITLANPSAHQLAPTPPAKPDGSPYRYEMIHENTRTWADTANDLTRAMLPEYAELDDEARGRARLTMAIGVQVRLQALRAVTGDFVLCRPEHQQLLLGERTDQPSVDRWDAPITLVLVANYYQPYTSLAGPEARRPGEVIWLDPSTDEALMVSLARAGVIGLAEHAVPAGGTGISRPAPHGD